MRLIFPTMLKERAMTDDREEITVSVPADRILNENYLRLRTRACTLLVWERLITEEDRGRFGSDPDEVLARHTAISLWQALHPVSLGRAVIDLAVRLNLMDRNTREWLLREIQEVGEPEEILKTALRSARLVLLESPRAVYWDGTVIRYDWDDHPAVWDYFLTLCEQSAQGRPVDRDNFGEHRADNYHVKMRSRLTTSHEFPVTLADRIVRVGRGQQKLDLPPTDIRILRLSVREVIEVL
jgi:hypothetical protein